VSSSAGYWVALCKIGHRDSSASGAASTENGTDSAATTAQTSNVSFFMGGVATDFKLIDGMGLSSGAEPAMLRA
jgi:hypothetical protein